MLFVVLFHFNYPTTSRILSYCNTFGYGGVDIFIFASGIGNYHSYLKDASPLSFLSRKIKRLAPTYIPFIIVWIPTMLILGKLDSNSIIGNLFGIQGLSSSGHEFNWFITCILICYILTPYFASFVYKHSLSASLLLVMVLIVLSSVFWNDNQQIISVCRLPLYVIGMCFAKYENYKLNWVHYVISLLLSTLGFSTLIYSLKHVPNLLWSHGLHWYPFIVIAPTLCIILSKLLDALNSVKCPVPETVFNIVGKHSFEIFLSHIAIFGAVRAASAQLTIISERALWIIGVIVVFPAAAFLSFVSNHATRIIK